MKCVTRMSKEGQKFAVFALSFASNKGREDAHFPDHPLTFRHFP